MRPNSDNQVMNAVVNGYADQKQYDSQHNTNYAESWQALNNKTTISDDLKFDLNTKNWSEIAEELLTKDIVFALCKITYEDGHSASTLVCVDNVDAIVCSMEMTLEGTLVFRINGTPAATNETSDSVMKMLTALSNINNVVDALSAEQKAILAKFAINGSGALLIESKAEFGSDVEVDGSLTLNSASDIVMKDGSKIGGGTQVILRRY